MFGDLKGFCVLSAANRTDGCKSLSYLILLPTSFVPEPNRQRKVSCDKSQNPWAYRRWRSNKCCVKKSQVLSSTIEVLFLVLHYSNNEHYSVILFDTLKIWSEPKVSALCQQTLFWWRVGFINSEQVLILNWSCLSNASNSSSQCITHKPSEKSLDSSSVHDTESDLCCIG